MTEREWRGEDMRQLAPGGIDKIPAFDVRTGAHLWTMTTAYRVDPSTWTDDHVPRLDMENLLIIAGPGCFYCERQYSPALGQRRCKGKP